MSAQSRSSSPRSGNVILAIVGLLIVCAKKVHVGPHIAAHHPQQGVRAWQQQSCQPGFKLKVKPSSEFLRALKSTPIPRTWNPGASRACLWGRVGIVTSNPGLGLLTVFTVVVVVEQSPQVRSGPLCNVFHFVFQLLPILLSFLLHSGRPWLHSPNLLFAITALELHILHIAYKDVLGLPRACP